MTTRLTVLLLAACLAGPAAADDAPCRAGNPKAALDAKLAKREFPAPVYAQERVRAFISRARKQGAAVTVNVGISPEGRLNPLSVYMLVQSRKE